MFLAPESATFEAQTSDETGDAILQFDVSCAQSLGQRDCQEDALVAQFAQGSDLNFVVLADGMGGHAAGDIASKIVVTEVFSEILFQGSDPERLSATMGPVLRDTVDAANGCIAAFVEANPRTRGMGATLVATLFLKDQLWWVSVGDSPLFLFRNGALQQLNQDHSLAPQIDLMLAHGLIDARTARTHPDRNVLTSVLYGDRIARMDCPTEPLQLLDGDVVIVASDGLQSLSDLEIAAILQSHKGKTAHELAQILIAEVAALQDPDQDNTSLAIVRVNQSPRQILDWRRHPSGDQARLSDP